MAVKALKCPNCDANIQVDDERDYGFCSYCGAQIQIKEIVEVRYSGEVQLKEDDGIEKQLEDGAAFIKMKEYHKAEQIFYRLINKHPGEARGYEMLICAITREHTLYIKENVDRIMKLADKMVAVAPNERKAYYERLYAEICSNFEIGMQEQSEQERLLKIGKLNKQIKEYLIICSVSCVVLILCALFVQESSIFSFLLVMLGALTGVSAVFAIGCKVRKNSLLKSLKQTV